MALIKIPKEMGSTPGIVDNSNATAITIGSDESATFSGPIQLTAGALAAAGNAGLSHRSTDNKVYLQAGTGGFNILDDQQNTHFAIASTGATTLTADATSDWALAVSNGSSSSAHGLYVNSPSTSGIPLRVDGGGSERMLIDASGRVRIGTGTTDTGTILTVTGAATFTGQNTTHGASRLKIGQDTTAISQIRFYGADTSTAGILQFTGSSSDGTVGGERMIIDGNGNVGIGTNSPTLAGTGYRGLAINGPTGQGASVTLKNAAGHTSYLYTERTGDDFLVEAVGDIVLRPAGAEKVRIDSTGLVAHDAGTVYSATAQGSGKGTIHLDPNSATNFAGNAITFGASDHADGQAAHAGIYTRTDGTLGSEMLLSTTDSYAAGPQTGIKISNLGNVTVPRGYMSAKQPAAIVRGQGTFLSPATTNGWNELDGIVNFTVYSQSSDSPWSDATGRFTAPIAGYYLCTASLYTHNASGQAHGSQYIHPQWARNGSVSIMGQTPYQIYGHNEVTTSATSYLEGMGRSDVVKCDAGDYLTMQVYVQNSNWKFYGNYTMLTFTFLAAT